MGGLRFKKVCSRCGKTYFTPDRKGRYCPRCLKKEKAPKKKHPHPVTHARIKRPKEPLKLGEKGDPSPELRKMILERYEALRMREEDLPLRRVHAALAQELRIQKGVVARVLAQERQRAPIPEPLQREVISRYVAYVERLERPPNGRRKTIARELGVPFKKVARLIREWKTGQPKVSEIPREVRFQIEKTYFRLLAEGRDLTQIGRILAESTGFSPWQVLRYLDLLHDGERLLRKVPDVTEEQRLRIEEGYERYLQAAAPPGPFLHDLLAEEVGVHYKQVHKVLLHYRIRFRRAHLGY